ARDGRDPLSELGPHGAVALGHLGALPETDGERGAPAREHHQADEAFEVAEPAEHLVADDRGRGDVLVAAIDADDGGMHGLILASGFRSRLPMGSRWDRRRSSAPSTSTNTPACRRSTAHRTVGRAGRSIDIPAGAGPTRAAAA